MCQVIFSCRANQKRDPVAAHTQVTMQNERAVLESACNDGSANGIESGEYWGRGQKKRGVREKFTGGWCGGAHGAGGFTAPI
jgi:hypothetical protein